MSTQPGLQEALEKKRGISFVTPRPKRSSTPESVAPSEGGVRRPLELAAEEAEAIVASEGPTGGTPGGTPGGTQESASGVALDPRGEIKGLVVERLNQARESDEEAPES